MQCDTGSPAGTAQANLYAMRLLRSLKGNNAPAYDVHSQLGSPWESLKLEALQCSAGSPLLRPAVFSFALVFSLFDSPLRSRQSSSFSGGAFTRAPRITMPKDREAR